MAPSDCVKLSLDPRVRVAGEVVAGTVEFDEAVASDEEVDRVVVKLRGIVHVCVVCPLSIIGCEV
jgi:hypothetical protein